MDEANSGRGISPSAFMRQLRPEYYSDTSDRAAYHLTANALEYHLETITSRNQTHDFELFCRKLCERTICPNLRPNTGPEGGGDGKVDTETYAAADEIASLTYVGNANSGREKWAFAFSANKKWPTKARTDVKGIVDCGRKYDQIVCVTSRFARAKVRARIEKELSDEHKIPVMILDRSWIVEQVIEHDRSDLAFNYLKIGESVANDRRLGPSDYSRSQQLGDIEKALDDPETFRGMELQRVTEALVAAKLSRGLERPRVETDGRFARSIRLADSDGTFRQQLEARYEHIWTAFWWYDDFQYVNTSYDDFQSRALRSDHAKNVEFLGNLNQLLVNSVVHKHMTSRQCRLQERTDVLVQKLEALAENRERPNNSLEAETALLRIKLNEAVLMQDRTALPSIWDSFGVILAKVSGLGEFDTESLVKLIEIGGGLAGNDPSYNALIEKLADFVASRKSEGEGAVILLNRAQKLDFNDHFDMIRWLGKAAIGLTKREYTEELIEALQLLTLAYRSAGLPWASRATCVFAAASIAIDGEEASKLSIAIVPTMKIWAWNALVLGHIPDFLSAIQMLNGMVVGLPLDDASKEKVRNDLRDLDAALGCLFLNIGLEDLSRLEALPDILAGLGLFVARTALLFALGHAKDLREDGSLPREGTDEDVERVLSLLKSQPVAKSLPGALVLNEDGRQIFSTTILGMLVEVRIESAEMIPVAEAILGSLEAFFATILEHSVAPHAELFQIFVSASDGAGEPVVETNELDMRSTVTWPRGLQIGRFDEQLGLQKFFAVVAGHVMGATCVVADASALLERLFADEAVQHRMLMILVTPNSYSRMMGRSYSRLSDWNNTVRRTYAVRDELPELPRVTIPESPDETEAVRENGEPPLIRNHKGISVSSVIDVHAWDRALWRGCGFLQFRADYPPALAFLYEDAEVSQKIFDRWRERFGDRDANEDVVISIIRNLPDTAPHHYCVQVSSRLPEEMTGSSQMLLMATRSQTMEPPDSTNLEWFLAEYRRFGAYFLLPAVGMEKGQIFVDRAILRRKLRVKSADDIGEHDIEALALRQRGLHRAP